MDVLVEWDNHSQNIVSVGELEPLLDGSQALKKGLKVRMCQQKKFRYGTILQIATKGNISSDSNGTCSSIDDCNTYPSFQQTCEVLDCTEGVFSSCHKCFQLLCYRHFTNMGACGNNHKNPKKQSKCSAAMLSAQSSPAIPKSTACLEISGKPIPKLRCHGDTCGKKGKKCSLFSEEQRRDILWNFYQINGLQCQRQYIARYVQVLEVKQRTVKDSTSRRSASHYYSLPFNGGSIPVCKTMFLNTLNISEKTLRTTLKTVKDKHDLQMTDNTDSQCHHSSKLRSLRPDVMYEMLLEEFEPKEPVTIPKEQDTVHKRSENKGKKRHQSRLLDLKCVNPVAEKVIPARNFLKPRCHGGTCSKNGKKCKLLSEADRQEILHSYYSTNSLQLQREYIVRYVKVVNVKQRTVKDSASRRSASRCYSLPHKGESIPVCKTMFLNTLNISEKTMRTALLKLRPSGVVEKDRRGGRPEQFKKRDMLTKNAIKEHIRKFPRIESNNCHQGSQTDYLHPDLNKKIMYEMFVEEYVPKGITACYSTYCEVLKSQNISFCNPRKS